MKIAIRYYTRSGNTRKLAEAVSEALAVEALDVSVSLAEKADVLFLGTSYYAFDADEAVKRFIADNSKKIGKIVCFGTSAMMKSMKKPIEKVAGALGVAVAEEEFHCRGQFGLLHKGRPDDKDLQKIKKFAAAFITQAER